VSEIAKWYEGRTVVITGCASGIGAALARLLIDADARLFALDYKQPSHAGLEDYLAVDMRDPSMISEVADRLPSRVDALFNCAGIAAEMGFEPLDVLRVNFAGLRQLTDALVSKISKGGSITSIASFAGRDWRNNMPKIEALLGTRDFAEADAWAKSQGDEIGNTYALSKEAVTVWTMREAAKLIKKGIRMNATAPGPVRTALMDAIDPTLPEGMSEVVAGPLGRYTKPEEQIEPLFFLGSGAAFAVNGVVLPVDGGIEGMRASQLQ
jgi:NAD(P)-dependent dehydrogenase (short-subunit alcohol dehydrogenase family)